MAGGRWRLLVTGLALWACQNPVAAEAGTAGGLTVAIELTSKAFTDGGMIPNRYTCDGEDISPPLAWRGVPDGTRSLALTCDDPDAPVKTWVHWVLFNLPPDGGLLPEGVPPWKSLSDGIRQGHNDFGRIGYGGPCPPGGTHRYYFRLYALDTVLELPAGINKEQLLQGMEGHVLAEGRLMGRYQR